MMKIELKTKRLWYIVPEHLNPLFVEMLTLKDLRNTANNLYADDLLDQETVTYYDRLLFNIRFQIVSKSAYTHAELYLDWKIIEE
jgi:hypothetical protein